MFFGLQKVQFIPEISRGRQFEHLYKNEDTFNSHSWFEKFWRKWSTPFKKTPVGSRTAYHVGDPKAAHMFRCVHPRWDNEPRESGRRRGTKTTATTEDVKELFFKVTIIGLQDRSIRIARYKSSVQEPKSKLILFKKHITASKTTEGSEHRCRSGSSRISRTKHSPYRISLSLSHGK